MDRKPLLDEGHFETIDLNFTDSMSNAIVPLRKKKSLHRVFLVLFSVILSIWISIDYYNDSMAATEASECWDVLADCGNVGFNDTVLPPFYDYLQDFVMTKKYGLSQCLIPKIMSTIATGMFCYLDDSERFTETNRTISTSSYATRLCLDNEKKSYGKVKKTMHKSQNVSNILLVRDPFDRFLSGFVEKCVKHEKYNYCLDCGSDIRCFLRKEYRRLKRISMLFPVYTVPDTHFAPQTWFCDMKNTLSHSTLIKYGNTEETRQRMIERFAKVLTESHVAEQEVEEVRRELGKGKSHDSTSGSEARKKYEKLVMEDVEIRRAIIRIYYWDFVVFGFEM